MRNFCFFAILSVLYALLVFSVGLVLTAPPVPTNTLPPNWQASSVQPGPMPTLTAEQLLKWQMIQQQQQQQQQLKPAYMPAPVPGMPTGAQKYPMKPIFVGGHLSRNGTLDAKGKQHGSTWSWFWDFLLGTDNSRYSTLGRNANATAIANATRIEMDSVLETGMALMGALLGRDQCAMKAACLAGDVIPEIQGRDFIFLAAERMVPKDWQPVYQVAKNSMMFKEDCKKYTCSA